MLGGHHVPAGAVALPSVRSLSRHLNVFVLVGMLEAFSGCGSKPSPATPTTPSDSSAISGLPVPGSADWCDPMPELGDPCTEDLKRCAIVCDYISDTCAMLVCTSGMWDYVEHGGDASSSGN